MKIGLRFILLLGTLIFATWASIPQLAHAQDFCDNYQGTSCFYPAETFCRWEHGLASYCICEEDETWHCPI